jgi:DNA-binding NtrC family response regulator
VNPRVLIIEDDAEIRPLISAKLRDWGYEPCEAGTVSQAKAAIADVRPAVVLLDIGLPDGSGLNLIQEIKASLPATPVIVMTGNIYVENMLRAWRNRAHFTVKPINFDALKVTIEASLLESRLDDRSIESSGADPFGGIVGQSFAMRQSVSLARRAAESPSSPVLITGETGTGKEMLAAAIHKASARARGPSVAVNCGALNPNLAESALFGHEKGAFTGALARVKGFFELADRGTLFLDEAAELAADLQVKLLRALQEHVIRRVGAETETPLDIRVIAATNRDLAKMLVDGRFRVDLFYRLAVIEINVPPLRERGDDVVLLANHFIRLLNAEHGKRVEGLQPEVESLFLSYPWPGNVRELRNAIERSIVLSDVDVVTVEALPEAIAGCDRRFPEQTHPEGAATGQNEISLDEMNVAAIQRAIEQAGGNISEAARRLKISRGRLRYLLDKLKDGKSRGAAR